MDMETIVEQNAGEESESGTKGLNTKRCMECECNYNMQIDKFALEKLSQTEKVVPDITFPDGSLYYGEVENNKQNGQGKIIYLDGTIYEGSWLNGLRTGAGH